MFEAKLEQGIILKKIVESIKDLVKSVNIDANASGISMQAMDSSHVALVSFHLKEEGFHSYRCDRPTTFGISIENMSKILKCASPDDSITLSAEENPTSLKFIFEGGNKYSEFNLNLLLLDSEQLGIPDTDYSSTVSLPSAEFTRICKELSSMAETVTVETTKENIKFSINGENGNGSTIIKANDSDKKEDQYLLDIDEPVNLSFALRYLNLFNKAGNLSPQVTLMLSSDTPLVVEYKIEPI